MLQTHLIGYTCSASMQVVPYVLQTHLIGYACIAQNSPLSTLLFVRLQNIFVLY